VSWVAASFAVLAIALAAGFAWYEREHPTTRVLALVATLAALAALGRIAFAPLPNVKPTTDIVLIAGYVLGGAPGFAVGAISALASNLFFGQGPWTPWQMAGWGACGIAGAALARIAGRELGRVALAAVCALAGLGFGVVMNLSMWVMYSGDHTLAKLLAVSGTSLPFDLAHAAGNALFCLAFGPALVRALARFRTRMEVEWRPLAAAPLALALAALVLAVPAAPAEARASHDWLREAQNADGGWGGAPGQASTGMHTGWALLGLAAGGTNPRDAGNAIAWLRARPGDVSDLGEISRTILVLRAAGLPAELGGRDLVAELLARQRDGGAFAGRVNTTSFAVLALRAAGRGGGPLRRAAEWIAAAANDDGGFNFAGRGGPSGIDDTAAAIEALAAAGRRDAAVTRRATAWLAGHQGGDGGFPLMPGALANAQSTAWAVQALVAAGGQDRAVSRALRYLRSLTSASGEVRYSEASRQTPVWVTAYAEMALARKPLPLAPVALAEDKRGQTPSRNARPTSTPTPAATPVATAAPEPRAPRKRRLRARSAATPVPAVVAAVAVAAVTPHRARALGGAAGLVAAMLRPPTAAM
jgi:energy-coupling factor transport system substrate-specific component